METNPLYQFKNKEDLEQKTRAYREELAQRIKSEDRREDENIYAVMTQQLGIRPIYHPPRSIEDEEKDEFQVRSRVRSFLTQLMGGDEANKYMATNPSVETVRFINRHLQDIGGRLMGIRTSASTFQDFLAGYVQNIGELGLYSEQYRDKTNLREHLKSTSTKMNRNLERIMKMMKNMAGDKTLVLRRL